MVVAAALPVRYAMTGLGVLVCAYTVGTLLPWRRAAAVVYADEHGVVTPGEDATGPGADGEEGRR